MDGCYVVIIAYRVCQLCASYSAMINFAMFIFREIYIYIQKVLLWNNKKYIQIWINIKMIINLLAESLLF